MEKAPSSPETGAFQTTPIAATIGVCLLFLSQIITQTKLDAPLAISCYGFAISLPLLILSYVVNKSCWQWPMREFPLLLKANTTASGRETRRASSDPACNRWGKA
jgi:hypothetical protein